MVKATIPAGSRFKGCQDILVRELRLSAELVCYRRERWLPGVPIVVVPTLASVAGVVGAAKVPLLRPPWHGFWRVSAIAASPGSAPVSGTYRGGDGSGE